MSNERTFENGCHIIHREGNRIPKDDASTTSRPKKVCEKLDKEFDGENGPNKGVVVGGKKSE